MDANSKKNEAAKGWTAFFYGAWQDIVCVLAFLALSFLYFAGPIRGGLVLDGADNTGGVGMGQEQKEYQEQTGEMTRWTNSVFSGMPTYQIAPSYDSTSLLAKIQQVYQLGTTGLLSYIFLYLLGFYVLLRAFNFRPYLAALGSVLWAFSSYFLIIIAAGHIWKVLTLCFIPPTIGGLVLCYRGRYLWGGAVTALFTAFQILSNHVQMSYYFAFLMLFIVVAYGIASVLPHRKGPAIDAFGVRLTPASWVKATCVIIVAGLIGVATNVSNLYHTYEYQKQSMRGKAELTPLPGNNVHAAPQATEGLERDYILQWSYGIDETMTLLVPNYKGGSSSQVVFDAPAVENSDVAQSFYGHAGALQQALQQTNPGAQPPGLSAYWGNQPFTSGPVYVGAFVCFLFVLGLFLVKGPMKWALLGATLLSLLFAWGKNIMPVANFFIDYLPMYNKFRAVSSALVVVEFTVPLLAVLCLARIVREPELLRTKRNLWKFVLSALLTAGVCFVLWVVPSVAGSCISFQDKLLLGDLAKIVDPASVNIYQSELSELHHKILSADAGRSLGFIVLGLLSLAAFAYFKRSMKGWMLCGIVALICLVDLWQVDKRYLNDEMFKDSDDVAAQIVQKTPADEQILQDKGYYRVLNLSTNIFNDNSTSYYHKSIGGYHPAKLHRYQDLIDRKLQGQIADFANAINQTQGDMAQIPGDTIASVLNMLNLKYIIFGQGEKALTVTNAYANGNGWFVQDLKFVKNADEEMKALDALDTKRAAVADESFRAVLGETALDSGSVKLMAYQPNELHYDVETQKGGVAVLSEIYYPGWTAEIDGQPVEIGRVNYVLRALKVPAGKHKLKLEFRPKSIAITDGIGYAAIGLTLLGFLFALYRRFSTNRKEQAFAGKDKMIGN